MDDLAAVAVQKAASATSQIVEAIGPETFTYRELVEMIATKIGVKRRIIRVPPTLGYWACRLAGAFVQDVIITREEIQGLMENRLYVNAPPLGWTKLSEWLAQHAATLGRRYTSELQRRMDRTSSYRSN